MSIKKSAEQIFKRAGMFKSVSRDGDGDGYVNDGTPQQSRVAIGGAAIEQNMPDLRSDYERSRDRFNAHLSEQDRLKRQKTYARRRKREESAEKKRAQQIAEDVSKPAHEMTRAEYREKYSQSYGDMTDEAHRRLIARAIASGAVVPDDVLAEYKNDR